MMEIKNVLIMTWGMDRDNTLFPKQDVKFPKETIVTMNFDKKRIVGKANNFRVTEEGIICDVLLDKNLTDTIAPSFIINNLSTHGGIREIKGMELQELSLIFNHSNEECNENLKEGYIKGLKE